MDTTDPGACSLKTTPYPAAWLALGASEDDTEADFVMTVQHTPPATWAPGVVVPGTVYRVIRPLGSGGMGDVYEAEHELLGVRRALKVLSRRLSGRDDLAERMRVEARALAQLRHPNIVQVHDLGISSDGRLFFAMELLSGTTLRDVIGQVGRLKVDQAVRVACEVLDALGAAHARGMIHRDVKPENVFLLEDGHLKLLDFGVAKAVAGNQPALTAAGMAVGTPRYMAPEQAQAMAVDARADLYSVGVVLWEMLVGRPPFAELDAIGAAVAAATRGIPTLEEMGVSAPADVLRAVRKATALDRDQRYSTAAAFAADLRAAQGASVPLDAMPERGTLRLVRVPISVIPPAPGYMTSDSTVVDGMPVGAMVGLGHAQTEAASDVTEPGVSVPDPRAVPTPTAVPAAPVPAKPAAAAPPPASSAPVAPLAIIGASLLVLGLGAGALWMLRAPSPPPAPATTHPSPAADPPPVVVVTPPPEASSAPPPAASAAPSATASAKKADRPPATAMPPAAAATPPKAPRVLPGSGLLGAMPFG
jgi:serine/threonine-protein kinase